MQSEGRCKATIGGAPIIRVVDARWRGTAPIYARKRPAGTQIARWYCRESHTTFSLLPDCLAARLPRTLTELEEVVAEAEQARSLMAVADQLRSDAVELPGAMCWVRRRVLLVHHVLRLVIGLLPQKLSGYRAEITACRQRLDSDVVLVSLRSLTAPWLPTVAAPLGFRPHGIGREHPTGRIQHNLGPDPPVTAP